MGLLSLEETRCAEYLLKAKPEQDFDAYLNSLTERISLIVTEGFEERSLAILQKITNSRSKPTTVIISRYSPSLQGDDWNVKYRREFETLAEGAAPGKWSVVPNSNDGVWLKQALAMVDTEEVLIDITGLSNRSLFMALDLASKSNHKVYLGYSEPQEYWPKEEAWKTLREQIGTNSIIDLVDKAPWLFGYEHRVELVEGHEGYDSPGHGRALVGFLPFKSARLAAILKQESYSDMLFIAGRPRLPRNAWRYQALIDINESLIKDWSVRDMSTFDYRKSVEQIVLLLFSDPALLQKYDVHLAILGSKLQTIACWIVSSLIKSLTIVTSVPAKYFTESFSEGIGASWVIRLTAPQGLA